MFCPYCGRKIGEDFVYCLNCGRKIPFTTEERTDPSLDSPGSGSDSPDSGSDSPDFGSDRPNLGLDKGETSAESSMEKKGGEAIQAPSANNRLEVDFQALVKRLPSEALAHFKNVDRDTWSVVKAGAPSEDVYKRHGLVGPYAVKICGVAYHAYAKEELLAASQVKFLRVWSGGAKKGIRRSRREIYAFKQEATGKFVSVVKFFIALFGILLAFFLLASLWGGL